MQATRLGWIQQPRPCYYRVTLSVQPVCKQLRFSVPQHRDLRRQHLSAGHSFSPVTATATMAGRAVLSPAPGAEQQNTRVECGLAYLQQLTEAALAALQYSAEEATTIAEVCCAWPQQVTKCYDAAINRQAVLRVLRVAVHGSQHQS